VLLLLWEDTKTVGKEVVVIVKVVFGSGENSGEEWLW